MTPDHTGFYGNAFRAYNAIRYCPVEYTYITSKNPKWTNDGNAWNDTWASYGHNDIGVCLGGENRWVKAIKIKKPQQLFCVGDNANPYMYLFNTNYHPASNHGSRRREMPVVGGKCPMAFYDGHVSAIRIDLNGVAQVVGEYGQGKYWSFGYQH